MGQCTFTHLADKMNNYLLVSVSVCLLMLVNQTWQCEVSVKNVGLKDFTWHIEYAGDWDHEKNLTTGEHDNYDCACVPQDMKIIYGDYFCYHYMNCINNFDYEVEVTDFAIYINVGHDNVEMCAV